MGRAAFHEAFGDRQRESSGYREREVRAVEESTEDQPGNYTVVLEPTAAADIVRLMAGAFNARNTEEGRTFISKRGGGSLLGEKVFPEFVTLRSDPFDPRQPSSPWTADQLPTRAITWVDKGVIAGPVPGYDRYWAGKTGKEPTPSAGGVSAAEGAAAVSAEARRQASLIMEGSDQTLEQLIAGVERGLLVTHFWYIRFVNQQTLQHTGLTRDGLFLIENGKITTPVMNFRFLESPVRLLKNTQRLGQAVRVRGLAASSDDRAARCWPRISRCHRSQTRFSTIGECFAQVWYCSSRRVLALKPSRPRRRRCKR